MKRILLSVVILGLCLQTTIGAAAEQHVFYVSEVGGNLIHMYTQNGAWIAGHWAALPTHAACEIQNGTIHSVLASFLLSGSPHVYCVEVDEHVHELMLTKSGWIDNDASAESGNIVGASSDGLTAYNDSSGERVFYTGTNQHVYQLYYQYSAGRWQNLDLTSSAGGHLCLSGGRLTSFGDSSGAHVFYGGTDVHVHQLYFGTSWHDQDLTSMTGGPAFNPNSGLTSFSISEHVYYEDVSYHVNELSYVSRWANRDITAASGFIPTACNAGSLLAYPVPSGESVFYILDSACANGNYSLFELFYSYSAGRWTNSQLTTSTSGNVPAGGSALAATGAQPVIFAGLPNPTSGDCIHIFSWSSSGVTDINKLTGAPAALGACFPDAVTGLTGMVY